MEKLFECIGIDKCSLCHKRKFKLYDIPIYNDIDQIIHGQTQESYMTCWNCLHSLLQNHVVIISIKSFIKQSIADMSLDSQNVMNNLLKYDKPTDPQFFNYAKHLTREEQKTIKSIIHKINKKTMC
jgi:hypothetical protein